MDEFDKRLFGIIVGIGGAFVVAAGISRAMAAIPEKAPATVEAVFDQDCEALLLRQLKTAHKELKVAVYEFTKKSFAEALIDCAHRGVVVRLKLDAHEAGFEYTKTLIAEMRAAKIKVELIEMAKEAKMHHKFAVIDGQIVATGSYNWTRRASDENWENLVVIESPAIAHEFAAEWDRIANK